MGPSEERWNGVRTIVSFPDGRRQATVDTMAEARARLAEMGKAKEPGNLKHWKVGTVEQLINDYPPLAKTQTKTSTGLNSQNLSYFVALSPSLRTECVVQTPRHFGANHFFLDPDAPHTSFVHGSHDLSLVILAIVVSVFSATMALQIATMAASTHSRFYRHLGLAAGAIALGGGIWTMHFIGMLAFKIPAPVRYDTTITLLSLVPALLASWWALELLGRSDVSRTRLVAGGVLVGAGIGAMHYTGMAAMQTPLLMRYEHTMFAVSIAVAIGMAILALWVRYGLGRTRLRKLPRLLLSGLVMGLAISVMHFTGMAAVRFMGEPVSLTTDLILTATHASLALSSFTITVTVMVVAVNGLIRAHDLNRRIKEGNSRLQATLDTAVDGIITINAQGIIQAFNHSAERLFGWQAHDVIGQNIKMLMPEPYQSAHDGYLNNYQNSGTAKIIGSGREVTGLRRDGSHVPLRLAVGRIEIPGEPLYVGFVGDISERHALETSLREAAQNAEQATAAKSMFLASVSHEIRTPMNAIIGFTELLLQSDLNSEQRRYLNTVRDSSRSLLRLINDILDTTKMEKGHLELEQSDFSLKSIVMQMESSLRLSAQKKGLTLSTHFATDMPLEYRGDPLRVLQILTNLVGNAIKFTESGRVEVRISRENDWLQIRVSDTGIGMTPEQVSRVFSPFTQADASISRRFGGTGLGTTIARQLAQQMGGTIDVDSTPDQGSTFIVHLPLPLSQVPQASDESASSDSAIPLPALNILIADDVPENLELLERLLRAHDHTVMSASNGQEAVFKYQQHRFDVALLDVHMPDVDGLQAARLIRQHEREAGLVRTPIVALTAGVSDEDRENALSAGMDGFSIKPLDPPRLFAEIARVLGIKAEPDFAGNGSPNFVQAFNHTSADPNRHSSATRSLDTAAGVNLWGSRNAHEQAVRAFIASSDAHQSLQHGLNSPHDANQLRFNLHRLRGKAGNLALPALEKLFGDLEALAVDRQFEAIKHRMPEIQKELEQVRALLTEPVDTPHSERDDPNESIKFNLLLDRMEKMISRREFDDDLLDATCMGLEHRGQLVDANRLRHAMNMFDFPLATRVLEKHLNRSRGAQTTTSERA